MEYVVAFVVGRNSLPPADGLLWNGIQFPLYVSVVISLSPL